MCAYVVWPVDPLIDGEGAFVKLDRSLMLPQLPVGDTDVAEGGGDLGVVWPITRFEDGEGAFVELDHAWE